MPGNEVHEEHLEIEGAKVRVKGGTLDKLKKVEQEGVDADLSSQDLDTLKRGAEAKKKIEKLQRSGS